MNEIFHLTKKMNENVHLTKKMNENQPWSCL